MCVCKRGLFGLPVWRIVREKGQKVNWQRRARLYQVHVILLIHISCDERGLGVNGFWDENPVTVLSLREIS